MPLDVLLALVATAGWLAERLDGAPKASEKNALDDVAMSLGLRVTAYGAYAEIRGVHGHVSIARASSGITT